MSTHIVPPPLDPHSGQTVVPVLIDLTRANVPIGEVLVQHYAWGIEVSVRPVPGVGGWTPASMVGGVILARSS